MSLPTLNPLISLPALEHPELMSRSTHAALSGWEHGDRVAVVQIDPEVADTAAMMAEFGLSADTGANCVIVSGKRAGEERIGAVLVRSDRRADVNGVAKRALDVRSASFHPMDRAITESGMEYGGITPLGLPGSWRLLVDPAVLDIDTVIIGAGIRGAKLLVPGELLGSLPGAEVTEDLGRPAS